MNDAKKEKMLRFWSERAALYGADPRANTNDVWLREVEIAYVNRIIQEHRFSRVLDFGCANGFSTARLAELNPDATFVGIDINPEMMIERRGIPTGSPIFRSFSLTCSTVSCRTRSISFMQSGCSRTLKARSFRNGP